jgi:hypothetical protein
VVAEVAQLGGAVAVLVGELGGERVERVEEARRS